MSAVPVVRLARPSDDPEKLLPFYCDGLGLEVLARFENHDGFDGIVVGRVNTPYHFEFTTRRGCLAGRAPSAEHLIALFYPDPSDWHAAVERMMRLGFERSRSINPYWNRAGATFEDPDGYQVILQNDAWVADG